MANVQNKENMTIAIREYTDNQGAQKKVWKTIGELITWDDGSKSFELWGPTGSTKGNVFAKDDNNNQQGNSYQGQQQRRQREHHGGTKFAGHDGGAGNRIDQQRFHGAAFLFTRGGIDGQIHPAHEQRQHDEVGEHAQDQYGAGFGGGYIHLFDHQCPGHTGVDATGLQAQHSDLSAVGM